MDQDHAMKILRHMVSFYSPSYQEGLLAAYLQYEMKRMGFHSFVDEVGNVIGEKGDPHGPTILLLGHMDTVSHPINVVQEESRLYGRGTVDAKGPLATLIFASAEYAGPPVHLVVIGAVEEETPGSRGAHHLLDRYHPDAVIIGEPSGWSNVVLGYKGRMGLHYTVTRPPSHMASPDEKATEVAITFWNALVHHLETIGADKSPFHHTIATLGQFSGTIEHAELDITCRLCPDFDIAAFEVFLNSILGDAKLTIDERTPCVLTDRSEPAVRSLTRSIRKHQGQVKYKLKTGTSDMNIVAQRWQVPMASYGPGDSNLDHTDNEHIDLNEYIRSIHILSDGLALLAEELHQARAQNIYTQEEEEALNRRLEALGYVE